MQGERRSHQMTYRRTLHLVGAIVLAGLFLAACSSSPSATGTSTTGAAATTTTAAATTTTAAGTTTTTAAGTTTTAGASGGTKIKIFNFAFIPVTLTVKPGAKVTVTNSDTVTHTLTADAGAFDTGDIAPGSSATFTAPSKPGTYTYHCSIHLFMKATLIVS
jgi:plastocyanin